MNIRVHFLICFYFSWINTFNSVIARLFGNCILVLNCQIFSRVTIPLFIPSAGVIQFFHLLASIWCCHYFRHFDRCKWYLIMVLIYTSLMAKDVKLFFMLITIQISSLVNYLCRSFAYFKITVAFFIVKIWEFFSNSW